MIRLPVHAGDMLTALLKMRAQLEGSLGRTPTVAELAEKLLVKKHNMLTQLAEWTRLGFITRTSTGTYAVNA